MKVLVATCIAYGLAGGFALIATGCLIMLVCCVSRMLYALYKGATDEAWR